MPCGYLTDEEIRTHLQKIIFDWKERPRVNYEKAKQKKKAINGAMYSKSNLEHNLREHIPSNSVEARRNRSFIYTQNNDAILERIYEKLFAKPYEEWKNQEIKSGERKDFHKLITRRLSRISRNT